jgi:hypothetical protein
LTVARLFPDSQTPEFDFSRVPDAAPELRTWRVVMDSGDRILLKGRSRWEAAQQAEKTNPGAMALMVMEE